MIVLLAIAYLPLIIRFAIIAFTEDRELIEIAIGASYWMLIPPQTNAVLNSVFYLARNSRMRRHFYKLLNCKGKKIHLQQCHPPGPNITRQVSPVWRFFEWKSRWFENWHMFTQKLTKIIGDILHSFLEKDVLQQMSKKLLTCTLNYPKTGAKVEKINAIYDNNDLIMICQ